MRAVGMGVVEESNSDDFNKGDQVMGLVGFQKYWQVSTDVLLRTAWIALDQNNGSNSATT